MIVEPERYIDEFAACGADGITIHLEASKHVADTLERIGKLGIKRGLAISPDTNVKELLPYLTTVDMILIMTVYPGRGGQKFIESCADKVREIRQIITERALHIDIEVDGGIKQDNTEMIMEAGANVIVVGSAVFEQEHTKENALAFLELFHNLESR
jgi:ribulose-phosphate 3-epimerase